MMRNCTILFIALLISCGYAFADQILFGKVGLTSRYVQDDLTESRVAGFLLQAKANHQLNQYFSASVNGGLTLETGSSQATYSEEYRPENTLFLQHAYLLIKPLSFFSLQIGALNQSRYQNPILFRSLALPAIRENIHLYFSDSIQLIASAQQAVPTSTSLATRVNAKKEGTPLLLVNSLETRINSKSVTLIAGSSFFQFRHLPSAVAHESRFYGNTIKGLARTNAKFVYDFQGFSHFFSLKANLFALSGAYLTNSKGPSGANTGYYGKVEFKIDMDKWKFSPFGTYYHNESDATPGFYNSRFNNHNNNKSVAAGLTLAFDKYALTTEAVQSKLIETNTLQADRLQFRLKLETNYHGIL